MNFFQLMYCCYRSCEDSKGICTYPSAHVRLTKKQQLLMVGQQYKMYLDLEMPESPVNQNLGNGWKNAIQIWIAFDATLLQACKSSSFFSFQVCLWCVFSCMIKKANWLAILAVQPCYIIVVTFFTYWLHSSCHLWWCLATKKRSRTLF
jgi:hypothetical protein